MSGAVNRKKAASVVGEMRSALLASRAAAERIAAESSAALEVLNRIYGSEQLAVALKALRTIANGLRTDAFSRSVASSALRRMGEKKVQR